MTEIENVSPRENYPLAANVYRYTADSLTYGSVVLASVLSYDIATGEETLGVEYQTWAMLGVGVLFGIMDKADGMAARQSEKLGRPISEIDKRKDPLSDKLVTHLIMLGLVLRETSAFEAVFDNNAEFDANYHYASAILLSEILTLMRDYKMSESRSNAVEGAEIQAIPINKDKTGVQNAAHAVAVTPFAGSPAGMVAVSTLYGLSTMMGFVGYKRADKIHKGVESYPTGS